MDIIYFMRKRENDKKKTMQTLVLISQIGLVMIVAIGLGTACGVWLDRKLGTSFLTVVFFVLGCMGGIQGAYGLINQVFGGDDREKK